MTATASAHDGPHTDSDIAATGDTSHVRIVVQGHDRIIESDGLPDHATGRFPNRGNPNTIRAQRYRFRVPTDPKPAEKITPAGMSPFGIALNGVPFDPGAAEFWRNDRQSGWQYEALSGAINLGLDNNHAHVQPNGAYHYHGSPTGLIEKLGGERKMLLLGYAADGFPIYNAWAWSDPNAADNERKQLKSSYRIKSGDRPDGPGGKYDGTFVQDYEYVAGAGDLDECNGRTGVTPEYPAGTYYYVITEDYPFIPRYFRGTPDKSFERRGPPGGPGGRRPPPPGRRPPPRP